MSLYTCISLKNKTVLLFAAAICVAMLTEPAYSQRRREPKREAEPTSVKTSALVPSLAVSAETPENQIKGGLRITVSPEPFKTVESWSTKQRGVPPPSKFGFVVVPAPNAVYMERTKVPGLVVAPDHLVFHVHLNNEMPRVFRGSGIAVQFNVAGKLVSVDSSRYGDLLNIILSPGNEQELTILGPDISSITAPTTIGLFFFDVVTNMDQAGNVAEKQNFEWYFTYQTQAVEKEFSVPPPETGWVVPK
jgi:hypothetical protein